MGPRAPDLFGAGLPAAIPPRVCMNSAVRTVSGCVVPERRGDRDAEPVPDHLVHRDAPVGMRDFLHRAVCDAAACNCRASSVCSARPQRGKLGRDHPAGQKMIGALMNSLASMPPPMMPGFPWLNWRGGDGDAGADIAVVGALVK